MASASSAPTHDATTFKLLFGSVERTSPYAFVLVVFKDPDYLLGAMACAFSLKQTNTKSDLVLLVTPDIPRERLELSAGLFHAIYEVPYLSLVTGKLRTERQREIYDSWKSVACTKWNCLGLSQYAKVVLVDADKIVLKNVDHLFTLTAPAGTFSLPKAEGYADRGKGIPNPYLRLRHGDVVEPGMIKAGLTGFGKGSSFVVIGTMILLEPSQESYRRFIGMLSCFPPEKPFGYPNCNNMVDEQAIVHFYGESPWTYISQQHNFVNWNKNWLRRGEFPPTVFHYFSTKPWVLARREWLDLEIWWGVVGRMIAAGGFTAEQTATLKKLYREDQLSLEPAKGCPYCKIFGKTEWEGHQFMTVDKGIICPVYA
jgi:hypothetical protein